MRAGVADIGSAHGEEGSLGVQRDLHIHSEIAGLIVAQKSFAALAGPFHGQSEASRGPGRQSEFGIDHPARAEIAADVLHDDAHIFRLHAEHMGEIMLQAHRAAAACGQGHAAGGGVIFRKGCAGLHGHARNALHPGVELHHMGGAGEGGFRRREVSHFRMDADVGLRVVPELRGVRRRRVPGVGDGGQDVVVHDHGFRRILGEGHRTRHDQSDDFADMAHLFNGHGEMRRREHRRPIGILDGDIGGM